jgi:SAM-dependent methyltransferase
MGIEHNRAGAVDRIAGLEADVGALVGAVDHFAQLEKDVVRDLAQLKEDVVRDLAQLKEDVVRDLAQLTVLTEQVSGLTERVSWMTAHLQGTPYITDETALRLTDADGRTRMGYVTASSAGSVSGRTDEAYADFEALFRGSRAEIQRRQRVYVDLFRHARGPVVDLGCGRGEFLEVLRDAGVTARGVDIDAGMVAQAHALGLDARRGDLFDELTALASGSLGGVFSAQVIEHLAPADMQRLVSEAHRVLHDDGVAVIETVNPHSVRALRFFWLDRTHTIPVYPESALMMARSAGFAAASILFPGGTGDMAEDLHDNGDFALVCAHRVDTLVGLGLVAHGDRDTPEGQPPQGAQPRR